MDDDRPEQASSSSSSSFFPVRGESSEPGSSSAPIHGGRFPSPDRFRYREMEEQRQLQLQQQQQQQMGDSYSRTGVRVLDDDAPSFVGEDTWSCVVVLITFWLFVSMTMILGVYGSVSLRLGPNSSFLLQPSPIFVQSIKVEETSASNPEVMLYGLYTAPSLDTFKTWSENYNVSVPTDSYKDLMYYLNKGSQIKVSYTVYSPSSSIFLVIAEGSDALSKWLENPSYPNTTLSWNIIHGSGLIWQNILTSSSYYVAVGNLNSDDVQVELNLRIKSSMYNTSEAYYKCNVTQGSCSINILFPEGNAAVITSTDSQQNLSGHELYVKLSYGPRWATYVVGIAGMTVLMLLAFNFLNKYRCTRVETVGPHEQLRSAREPLISHKDDDLSSWGSSYDSVSNDEKDLEDLLAFEGKSFGEGENSNNTRRLCAICFDAPRDCFFLPCGHCVACFACGTRIAEADGTCPICRRKMKKVRRIFTV